MIGVFDSGVGGLSVLTQIRGLLPSADLMYVADRARAPYGTRSLDELRTISVEIATWLVDRGATTLVIACNTASAAALHHIRELLSNIAVVGMEPAVKPAASLSRARKVGVFATAATFQGQLFDSVVSRFASETEVLTRACPEWVDLVERGVTDGPVAATAVERAISPIVGQGADVLVLGCTHFSFLHPLISSISGVPVIDPAPAVARQVATVADTRSKSGVTRLAASGDLKEFRRLVSKLTNFEGEYMVYPG